MFDINTVTLLEKKKDIWRSCLTNYHQRKIDQATWHYKNATRIVDYTAIADRLRNQLE